MRFWSAFDRITKSSSFKVGSHRIILDGRYTVGPQFQYAALMLCVVLLCEFCVFESVVSGSIILSLIFLSISIAEIVLLLKTAMLEPGIVPPGQQSDASTNAPSLATIVNGVNIERKFCYTCNVYRPPRGKHCVMCGCCVDRHDHHCKFLSNCIGLRNYRSFVFFILNTWVMALFTLLLLLLTDTQSSPGKWWLLLIVSVVALGASSNLLNYHGRLILAGTTSYEDYKGVLITDPTVTHEIDNNDDRTLSPRIHQSPFSLGSWQMNLNAFLMAPTDDSRLTAKTVKRPPGPKPTMAGRALSEDSGEGIQLTGIA